MEYTVLREYLDWKGRVVRKATKVSSPSMEVDLAPMFKSIISDGKADMSKAAVPEYNHDELHRLMARRDGTGPDSAVKLIALDFMPALGHQLVIYEKGSNNWHPAWVKTDVDLLKGAKYE